MAQYFTDFSGDSIAAQPADTTLKRSAAAGDYSVRTDDSVNTLRYFDSAGGTTARGLAYDLADSSGVTELFAEIRDADTSNPPSARLVCFASDSPDNEYGCVLNTVIGRLIVYKRVAGAFTTLAQVDKTVPTSTYVNARLRVTPGSPNQIQLKTWEGATEPGTWDLDTTDSDLTLTTGWTGHVGFDESANIYYKRIGIGTAGDAAPTEAVGDTYTLSLATGSVSLTGGILNTQVSRQLSLSGGSYSTTGGELSLLASRALALNVGGFALTGGDLNLLSARKLDIASGTYSLTGGDVNFVYTPNAGAFELTLEQGTFTLTGQALSLLNSRLLSIDAGSFGVSGGDLDIVNGYVLDLASGTFLLTGQTLDFSYDRAITLQQGDIIVTGGVLSIRPSSDISSTLVMPNQSGVEQVSLVDLTAGELGLNLTTGKMWTVDQSFNLVTVGGLYNGQDLPRSDPQTLGAFWNDNGILKVSAG